MNKTKGYTKHPQLIRFSNSPSPVGSIAVYLQVVHSEALKRGYNFDKSKICSEGCDEFIAVTAGQLEYEWKHLKAKLKVRSPEQLKKFKDIKQPDPHSLFHIIPGPVEYWEVV
ncbi:MAG: DNA lyase [Ignavibacteriales bacterium]|nr:MAG: DNA lyase [Ignavibacteriales bacterium]